MCNLYKHTSSQEANRRLFGTRHDRTGNLPPLEEIFPGFMAPVVRTVEGERELVMMRWGFVLPQEGRAPRDVTNTRYDKVSSGFWRESFEQRRCLVPVTAFCEWTDKPNAAGKKDKVWFGVRDVETFAFAGLWKCHRGYYRKGELVDWNVFSFLTCEPNELVRPVHAKAMPVLLTPETWDAWIDGSAADALALARPFPSERMEVVAQ